MSDQDIKTDNRPAFQSTSVYIDSTATVPASVTVSPFCVIQANVRLGDHVTLGVGCVIEEGAVIGAGASLGHHVTVAAGAVVGEECEIAAHVSIGSEARIGARTRIGEHTAIYPQAELGEDGFIGSSASIGRFPKAAATSTVKSQAGLPPLKIGNGYTIGCSAVLYAGTAYGDQVFLGDGALVRERCTIGRNVVIGSGAAVENDTRIGDYTKIQTGSYITAYMELEERVFIAPMVTTTNDNYMGRTEKRFESIKGASIGRGARVGGGSILLPGIRVAPETFVAAGALVTKDTEAKRVVKGFPAKDLRDVSEDELLPED
ncbi:MAG TPA: transferase [Desulfitobacterium dehalogenans]|uniref:Transferase n=1 Tax=Desulfitobacterium dehalogenans TaxID=36854 RepID=A0A7C6Z347_9FIRM|nr:transferase [Desulfitobacterium dehalogenans]